MRPYSSNRECVAGMVGGGLKKETSHSEAGASRRPTAGLGHGSCPGGPSLLREGCALRGSSPQCSLDSREKCSLPPSMRQNFFLHCANQSL